MLKGVKYVFNGKSVCSQLTESQYRYFCKYYNQGYSIRRSFFKAKKMRKRKDISVRCALNASYATYETKISTEISFLKKQIARYQERRKRKLGSEKVFYLPIPKYAKPELESVILATRLGTLIMEEEECRKKIF